MRQKKHTFLIDCPVCLGPCNGNVSNVDDMTIMPDGRPFFAWQNELKGLREEAKQVQQSSKNVAHQMHLLKIARIESEQEPWSGDIIVRFRMMDSVNDLTGGLPTKYTIERNAK